MDSAEQIDVEVCYARPERQDLIKLCVESGTTLKQAIEESGILQRFPEIDLAKNKIGVFARLASLDQILRDGDRVEIYRPLLADPKEIRRQRATEKRK